METSELIKKVRKIEIKTRGLSKQIFSGEYHSAFKGRGMAFSEVREYQAGDEIRTIDWNVTARTSAPYVKVFEEERELIMMLIIDISASENFGTSESQKKDIVTELSAVLAFSALQNNDKIGLILFSDKVEKYIPPKKGKSHVLRIIRELIEFKPTNTGTSISEALKYFNNVTKKRSIAFIVSDFIDSDYFHDLKIASKKHDTIAVQIFDKTETEIPNIGLIKVKNPETNQINLFDTSSKKNREIYSQWWENKMNEITTSFKKAKVDFVNIRTDESYITPLQKFFKKRESKR
jgi:uncharacterized protein (DUF58 family)